jgi:hypothetical protein
MYIHIYIHTIYARRYLCQHMWNATALDGTCASMLRVKASVLQTPCPQLYFVLSIRQSDLLRSER